RTGREVGRAHAQDLPRGMTAGLRPACAGSRLASLVCRRGGLHVKRLHHVTRVLARGVIVRELADVDEAKALVERDGGLVGLGDLEKDPRGAAGVKLGEQRLEQAPAGAAPALRGRDRQRVDATAEPLLPAARPVTT